MADGTVLLVANYRPDTGYAWWLMENFWIELAGVARALGMQPLLAYPVSGPVPASIRQAEIEVVVQSFAIRSPGGLLAALRLARARRVRCMYLTDRPFTSFRYLLYRLAGVRRIITHDHQPGDRPPVRGLRGLLKALWRRLPFMSADLQICVSPLIRRRAIENARIPAERTVVVQNGIVPLECEDEGYVRKALSLPRDSFVCVTVGRAHDVKRIDLVIEAARRCVHEIGLESVRFVHCGDGPDLERLRALAGRAGLKDHFIFAGRRSDVAPILCSADVAVHAARGEAFSLAVLEYMSAGLAVLVPDVPTVAQAIDHGRTGLVYRNGDADEAAALVAELFSDPDRRTRLGRAAEEEVRTRYSLEAMNRTFRRIVSETMPGSTRPVA